MITFIYPEGDWTAAEVAIKIQALASSQGHKVYSPPKVGKRDEEDIGRRLSRSKYAILVAYDSPSLDPSTKWELETLSSNNATIYSVVPHSMRVELEALGVRNNLKSYDFDDIDHFIQAAEAIMDDIRSQQSSGTGGELLVLLLLFGMLIFFIALLFEQ